ncbi:MAG: hypothetical protein NW217_04510 [Hyphomicrobiaceae bacterium]|nr:hypothetical protein [Hyphomicrobiaceae bacterium]
MPSAVPASVPDVSPLSLPVVAGTGPEPSRAAVLSSLRASIARLEKPRLVPSTVGTGERAADVSQAWTLGDPCVDALLGPSGLDFAALHEIRPVQADGREAAAAAVGRAGALAFALRLAARRRVAMAHAGPAASQGRRGPVPAAILVCLSAREHLEIGRIHASGLAALGLDTSCLLIAETARQSETLWAMEEALNSAAVGLVVGCLEDLPLTPARRLALAAEQHAVPCLAVTAARAPAAGATASRWRIGPAPAAAHPLDAHAPGMARCEARLERLRRPAGRAAGCGDLTSFVLEWCDEALRFRLAA